MGDVAFLVLLFLVFAVLAVVAAVGSDRQRHARRRQRDHERTIANALWEVKRLEKGDHVIFELWRYPDSTYTEKEWRVNLGQKDDVKFMDQHSTVLTQVEAERDRRNFELSEIRRAAENERRALKR